MKKHILPFVFAMFSVVFSFAQQPVNAPQKFNANVVFNDSTYGNASKVPVTTFEDTVRITRGAGNGKVLASDANGNAFWTNVVLVDTFSGTPVFPSGIKTDTVFTTDFNGTGYVMQLVNDTTGLFKPMIFANLLTKTGDTIKLGGTAINNTTLNIGANDIRIASSDGLTIGINDSLGVRNAFMQYTDDTAIYTFSVNQFGASITHQHQSQIGHFDGLLSIVHYENSLNRKPGDGRLLSISNTNALNVMSITDTATGREISKFENTDSVAKVLVNYNSQVQFKSDAMLGVYSDEQKWRIDSSGLFTYGSLDSVTLYALIPDEGTVAYCNNCTGTGVTGRVLAFFGAAWRRLLFED